MRIIRKRRSKKSTKRLSLKIDIIQAKDLVLSDSRTCIMVAGIAFNGQSKKTPKVKRTANPTWNSSLKVRLSSYEIDSPILHVAVFDKHRKYSIYLGEVRISVVDLFEDKKSGTLRTKVDPVWYKLYSSSSQNTFVTGSIKIGFELSCKSDPIASFKRWQANLLEDTQSLSLNEQGFYSDTETDVESLLAENSDEVVGHHNFRDLKISSEESPRSLLEIPQSQHLANQSSESNYSSDFSVSEASNFPDTAPSSLLAKSALSNSSISARSHHLPHHSHLKQPIAGVVFLQILSATGLPPYKTFLQKGFDMDPFVVISFGKKTFRTSWRKHTLNPVFSQSLAFEVLTSEKNFDLVFNILDKDHISYHDKVAFGSIPLTDVVGQREFMDVNLRLKLYKDLNYEPYLKLRVKFKNYEELKRDLWSTILSKYTEPGSTSIGNLALIQLTSALEDPNIEEDLINLYTSTERSIEDSLNISDVLNILNNHEIKLERCPICGKRRRTDMVTHVAVCASQGNKLKSYATAGFASKRWYSKVLIKFAYGKYAIGKNNANILVQDRLTGFIMEEKMSLYIRLGIRLLYKGKGADSKRIKNALRNLSIKQGAKFDQPSSAKDIDSFIKFHQLDLSECETTEFKTFNEFFYRKLKPDARLPESTDPKMITSPADSRATSFKDIDSAKKVWIKGRQFTVARLLGDAYNSDFENCSVGIFRLAPQDYHRFHSPVDGVIGKPLYIQGEYYTVNPMAIRSDLDVFGENVRVVIPIETDQFGLMFFVSVGAMMVGSTILTVKEGDRVAKTDELGYFKFGGSTIITLFQKDSMVFDSDLLANSSECIETLVRVGMCVGHSPDIEEFSREKVMFSEKSAESKLKIIRTITGGDVTHPWEFYNINVGSDDSLDSEDESDE